MIVVVIALSGLLLAGCSEFLVGAGTGAAIMEKAQNDFVKSVEELNKVTVSNNEVLANLIKPETIEAVKSLKGREKDPATWIALASILANGIWAGRTIEKKVRKK